MKLQIIVSNLNPLKYYRLLIRIYRLRFLLFNPRIPIEILYQLSGVGIEVGALSNPLFLPKAEKVFYADIVDEATLKSDLENLGFFGYNSRKFVSITYFISLNGVSFPDIADNTFDFVVSSHSLEHSSNPICNLVDYIRVVRVGGLVYTRIPNKDFTYDKNRSSTDPQKLIQKFVNKQFGFELGEFIEMVSNSLNEVYFDYNQEDIYSQYVKQNGHHHIYVYDLNNIIKLIDYIIDITECKLIYINNSGMDIDFCLKKM
jgi:SAM-dependent methyltransferase